jgi:2-polyprenyl-3-methyl-5-hydroxy-6-metoxy-1,4-benzoquinol methylase
LLRVYARPEKEPDNDHEVSSTNQTPTKEGLMSSIPNNYYGSDRPEIAPFLPNDYARVLEIGCGEGTFSKHLRKGSEVWGCEPNKQAAAAATLKLHRVFTGKYNQIVNDVPNNFFDLVICNDVIEHMEDHDWFLDSIREKMQPNACLVGSIPNMRHIRALYSLLFLKDWPYQDFLTFDRTHLRWFTEKSLFRAFHEHQFVVEMFQGINGTKKKLFKVFFSVFNMITLGSHSDIEHLQFAFRIRKA